MKNNLPKGWVETTISEYAVISKSKDGEGRTPYLEIGDIDIYSKTYELKDKPSVKGCKSSKKNDVLISRVRPTRGAIAIINEDELCVSSAFTVLKFNEEVESKSVFYQLAFNSSFLNYLGENCTGTMYPTVSEEIIGNYKISIPPLPEQHRIVAKLDALFEKIESNKQRLEKISQIEQKVFLKNIFNDSDFYSNIKLKDYCKEQTERVGDKWKEYRLIGVSKDNGVVDLRVGGKKTFETYKIVKPGWFLYNPMRIDIGSVTIWEGDEDAITSPDYVVFSIQHSISPLLLLKYLKSSYGLSEINNNTQGAVRSRLYYRNLSNINFPFSGVEKHREAELILCGFNKLNKKKDKLDNLLNKLQQSILAKAFRGELVAQDPNDEPASVLLERIKAEKEKLATGKKGKKTKTYNVKPKELNIAAEKEVDYD